MSQITFSNCGFETGDATGWTLYSDGTSTSNATVSATSKYYGNYGLELHGHVIQPDPGNIQIYAKKTITINSGDILKFVYKIVTSTVSDSAQEDRKTRLKVWLYRGDPYYDSEEVFDLVSPSSGDWILVEYTPTLTGSVDLEIVAWAVDAGYS